MIAEFKKGVSDMALAPIKGVEDFEFQNGPDTEIQEIDNAKKIYIIALQAYIKNETNENAKHLASSALDLAQRVLDSDLSRLEKDDLRDQIHDTLFDIINNNKGSTQPLLFSFINMSAEVIDSTEMQKNLDHMAHIEESILALEAREITLQQFISTYMENRINTQLGKKVIEDTLWPWTTQQQRTEEAASQIDSFFSNFVSTIALLVNRARVNSIREEAPLFRLKKTNLMHKHSQIQNRQAPLTLRETLLEFESQIQESSLAHRNIFRAKPNEKVSEQEISQPEDWFTSMYDNHSRDSMSQHDASMDLLLLATSSLFNSKSVIQSYQPILQGLPLSLRNVQVHDWTRSIVGDRTKQQIPQKKSRGNSIFSLKKLKTRSDLKYRMRRKDARKADRLAKRINCMKNSRPELRILRKDLYGLSDSHHYNGSIIRRLRAR